MRQGWGARLWRSSLVCVAAIAALAGDLRAGSPADAGEIAFDTWTVAEGLPQGSIYDIVQTPDGYLWLATLGGLVRFDGVRFTVFEKATAPGIGSNRFMTLFIDRAGALWAGTENGGVTRYANARFRTFTTGDGLPDERIRAIDQEEGGAILVLTDRGLARLVGQRFQAVSVAAMMPLNPQGIPGRNLHAGISLRDGESLHTLFGGQHYRFDAGNGVGVIESRYRDQRGVLWGWRSDGAILRFEGRGAALYTPFHPIPHVGAGVFVIHEDRDRNLWLSFEGAGIVRIGRDGIERFTPAQGLAGLTIAVIFEDREGNLWFGSLLNGLSRLRRHAVTTISRRNGLPADNVYPLLQRRNGDVWVGTWGGGVARVNGSASDPASVVLPGKFISALAEDREGRLWVGTAGSGVFRIEEGKAMPVGSPGDFVLALHEDRKGTMWVGTTAGLKTLTPQTRVWGLREGLPNVQVQGIMEDPAGVLWLATLGGVVRFDGRTFQTIGEREGLSSNHVRSLYCDSHGVIWAGTYDGGLNRIEGRRITVIQKEQGLFDNGVFTILDDGSGNLWMTSNRGIFRTRKKDLDDFAAGRIRSVHSVGYGTQDGMASPECNGGSQPSGLRTTDGRLWFPTQGGIAIIDPARIPINMVVPPVSIENVTTEEATYAGAPALALPPGTGRFRIEYAALSFIKPEQIAFRYRLEGLDDQWVEAGAERTAYYSHVPPGHYTFRVLAANSDGIWNKRGASISIEIRPPWWRTKWFGTLVLVSLALALFALHRARIRSLERARDGEQSFLRRLMLSEEAERTRIASELHDSLGQSLMVIANRAIMASRDAERGRPFEEHLAQISETSMQAAEEVREIAHNLHPQHLERLGLTRALGTMIDRARASTPVEIVDHIDPVDRLFRPELELSFYRLVQEALTNVLRHADATHAAVEIHRHDEQLVVAVRDDGRGFDMPQASAPGLGLESIRQRATMLGGALHIESRRGAGTLVSVEIPLPERDADA